MSQFDCLSPKFKDELDSLAERLAKKKTEAELEAEAVLRKQAEEEFAPLKEFSDGLVRSWFSSLGEESRKNVRALFAEINNYETDGLLKEVAKNGVSPFAFVASFIKAAPEGKTADE